MSWMKQTLRWTIGAALLAGLLFGSETGVAAENTVARLAAQRFKKDSKSIAKSVKKQLDDLVRELQFEATDIFAARAEGSLEAIEAVNLLCRLIDRISRQYQETISQTLEGLDSLLSNTLAGGDPNCPPPQGLGPGDCGDSDKAVALVTKSLTNAQAKLDKALKKIVKQGGKVGGIQIVIQIGPLNVQVIRKPVAIPGGPSPKPRKKPFVIDVCAGFSEPDRFGDGVLMIVGGSDPSNGTSLTIRVTGPNGFEAEQTDIDLVACRFTAVFRDLEEGLYEVEAIQSGFCIDRACLVR